MILKHGKHNSDSGLYSLSRLLRTFPETAPWPLYIPVMSYTPGCNLSVSVSVSDSRKKLLTPGKPLAILAKIDLQKPANVPPSEDIHRPDAAIQTPSSVPGSEIQTDPDYVTPPEAELGSEVGRSSALNRS